MKILKHFFIWNNYKLLESKKLLYSIFIFYFLKIFSTMICFITYPINIKLIFLFFYVFDKPRTALWGQNLVFYIFWWKWLLFRKMFHFMWNLFIFNFKAISHKTDNLVVETVFLRNNYLINFDILKCCLS